MSVHWPIIRRLIAKPFATVIVDDRRSYKAFELLIAANHAANAIERQTKAKNVGLMLPTSGAFPIAAIGAWSAGRTVVPLNYLLKPGELQYVVDDSALDTIVTVGPMLDFVGDLPKGVAVLKLEELNFKSLPAPRVPAQPDEEDTAALVYTSGTSGKPKGVMLSHRAIRANAKQGASGMELRTTDTMLGVLPQFHSYGLTQLTLTPLMHGVRIVYTARFQPKKLIDLIREHRATCMVGIPSMFNALAAVKSAGPEDVKSLRLVVSGSEALSDAVFDRFKERYGIPINEGYGMTEMGPATHCCLHGESRKHTVGPPLPGVEQRIVDVSDERTLPPGEEGEIRLRGPNQMSGYWKLPEETANAFDEEGWYRTGDLGKVDPDGYLRITGRIKEIIIVGGENVGPREIEDVLNRHPAVHASGVVGTSDSVRGEVPIAFVELAEDAGEVASRDLQAFCREHLAGYKVPREVHFVDELPRSPTGKVLRRELMAMRGRGESSETQAV